MNGLYFNYGGTGSGKTAQALMCKFNYEQNNKNVLLLKSMLHTRDVKNGEIVVKSRIGLSSTCKLFSSEDDLIKKFKELSKTQKYDVIIVDECQFATPTQIEQLKKLSKDMPVLCYGLLIDFQTNLFQGSKRLIEIADSITEIKSVCKCGGRAIVPARYVKGKPCFKGNVVAIEDKDTTYISMCLDCYNKLKEEELSLNSDDSEKQI